MSPNETDLEPTKAMASAQPIGATTSQSPQTSLQLVVRLKTNTIGYTTTTSPIPQSASQESTGLTSPTTQKEVNDSCANCAGSASYRCVGCVDGVDVNGQVSSTFYCGQECQRQHWDTVHKRQCRLSIDRRQLHRIGSFLQWAFYAGQTFTRHETIRRVKRIENTTPGNDDPEMIVWLDKNQDSAHFARFPEEMFTEGRERQAVLAHAAAGVTVVTEMMKLLREGSRNRIQVREVAVRLKTRRFTRFVPRIPAPSVDPSVSWIFRATLKDGSAFAIDVCNAQYTVNTPEDADRGVFPWEQYLTRLRVAPGDVLDEQALGSRVKIRYTETLTGTVEELQAGIITPEDKQNVAEHVAMAVGLVASTNMLPEHGGLTVPKLIGLPSPGHEEGLNKFKDCHQRAMRIARDRIDHGDAQRLLLKQHVTGFFGPP